MNLPNGFALASANNLTYRLIASICGWEKTGKSHFLCTAPDPIVLFDFDLGIGRVDPHLRATKQILQSIDQTGTIVPYRLPMIPYPSQVGMITDLTTTSKSFDQAAYQALERYRHQIADEAQRVWARFVNDLFRILKNPGGIRTIEIDTADEAWDLLRLARHGKLSQVPPHLYTELNLEFQRLIDAVKQTGLNLLLVHRYDDEYKDVKVVNKQGQEEIKSTKTGKPKRSGYKRIGFIVDVEVETFRDDEGFKLKVIECGQNPLLKGEVLEGTLANIPMTSFTGLAISVFEGTGPEDWT